LVRGKIHPTATNEPARCSAERRRLAQSPRLTFPFARQRSLSRCLYSLENPVRPDSSQSVLLDDPSSDIPAPVPHAESVRGTPEGRPFLPQLVILFQRIRKQRARLSRVNDSVWRLSRSQCGRDRNPPSKKNCESSFHCFRLLFGWSKTGRIRRRTLLSSPPRFHLPAKSFGRLPRNGSSKSSDTVNAPALSLKERTVRASDATG
jgi:hypothetical protein